MMGERPLWNARGVQVPTPSRSVSAIEHRLLKTLGPTRGASDGFDRKERGLTVVPSGEPRGRAAGEVSRQTWTPPVQEEEDQEEKEVEEEEGKRTRRKLRRRLEVHSRPGGKARGKGEEGRWKGGQLGLIGSVMAKRKHLLHPSLPYGGSDSSLRRSSWGRRGGGGSEQ